MKSKKLKTIKRTLTRVASRPEFNHGHRTAHVCYLALLFLEGGPRAMLAVILLCFEVIAWVADHNSQKEIEDDDP